MLLTSGSSYRWRIGDIEITRVLEFEAALFEPAVIHPAVTAEIVERHRSWLEPRLINRIPAPMELSHARARISIPSLESDIVLARMNTHGGPMHLPLRLVETEPGSYSLLLDALTAVDGAIKEVGHEPNGYFWEGVARYLVQTEAAALADRILYDPEGSMFCAYAESRDVLEALAALMRPLTTDAARVRRLVTDADAAGFQFDD